MVIIRESPRLRMSPGKSVPSWPPKSPHQALLSSPSGRKKWQGTETHARDTSPSPSKRSSAKSTALYQCIAAANEDDLDMDENALRLELREIQIRQQLARLAKAKQTFHDDVDTENAPAGQAPSSPPELRRCANSRHAPRKGAIEVPLSPAKDRVIEGLDLLPPAKQYLGLSQLDRAQHVSLKRARDGTQLVNGRNPQALEQAEAPVDAPKGLSFSERLAATRTESQNLQMKQERIEKSRSNGFTQRSAALRNALSAVNRYSDEDLRIKQPQRRPNSAQERMTLPCTQADGNVSQTRSLRTITPYQRRLAKSSGDLRLSGAAVGDENPKKQVGQSENESSSFESFSELHLSKRYIPHIDVARALEDTEIYTLPRLLKEVKAPEYQPPDVEGDFIVIAILASKSSPYNQNPTHRTSEDNRARDDAQAPRNKFMVFHLCDLEWEVDMFLFGSGFDQFWKISEGTVLAILNPAIMPPKTNQHSGRFCLKLSSSEDKVMELGIARDLGYCVTKKKNGQQCGDWIDKRKAEVCDFHLNLLIDRGRKHRMEVNGMFRGFRSASGSPDRTTKSRAGDRDAMQKPKGKGRYHHEYGRLYSVDSGQGKSAASLLDAEDADMLSCMTQEERSRRRIAAEQKDRDLQKKLAKNIRGTGQEHLRQSNAASEALSKVPAAADNRPGFDAPTAANLGLLGKKASDIHLSPGKDRRRHFGVAAVSSAGSEAMGWGGARKSNLLQPKESRLESPEKRQTQLASVEHRPPALSRLQSAENGLVSLSPKKRARFALEKGIREPGRESLGADGKQVDDDDDDDDLDIV